MANYLVTGAAGFIGSKVAELLLAEGHTVAGVDNLNDAYPACLKQWRLDQLLDNPGFRFERADVTDREGLARVWLSLGNFDAVINLAARAGVRRSVEDPWSYVDTNVTGTLNLLQLCRERGTQKFVLASTSSLYGEHNPMPYREDADTGRPLSPYAASKKAAEALCHSYHHLCGLDVSILRYFTVYGPAGRPDMSVFRFVQAIAERRPVTVFGNGRQSRDFTYVDDIARGTISALRPMGYATINLGSDRPVILLDLVHEIERGLGAKADIVYCPPQRADVPATWAAIQRARECLGWEPKVPYPEGIANSIQWYLENREWARAIEAV